MNTTLSNLEVCATRFWEQLDTPISLSLAIKARYGDWEGVLSTKVEPTNYEALLPYGPDFGLDLAATSFLKKNPYVRVSTPERRVAKAKENWLKGEAKCYATNQRLARFLPGLGVPAQQEVQAKFLSLVRDKVLMIVGSPPSDAEVQDRARHGPGTTYSSLVRNPTVADKFSEKPTLTRNAVWHLADLVGTRWGDAISSRYISSYVDCVDVIRGDRFATAPKDALKDRAIVIGPSINTYFQLGVGACLRQRLRARCGWDLNTAADIHRKMAQVASVDGSFSTIDLSNASDSLCKNLVRILYTDAPIGREKRSWFSIMNDLRTTHTFIDGGWRYLEKFSGMGNGYTFELETITFYAIVSVCLELKGHAGLLGHDCFVFGDDIIVPTDSAAFVVAALKFLGFEINQEKTFIDGSFKESCGGDFFAGTPVRGYYFKGDFDAPDSIYACHNGIHRVLSRYPWIRPWVLDWARRRLPEPFRDIGGPSRLGDQVLHGVERRFKWRDGIRWLRVVRWERPTVIPWRFFSDDVRLTCRILHHGSPFGVTARGSIPSWTFEWVSDS